MRRPLTVNIAQAICAAVLIIFGIANAFSGPEVLGLDFVAYLTGATIVANGDGRSLYDRDVQKEVQSQLVYPYAMKRGLLPYNSPPWVVLPFLPLAKLPYKVGYITWSFVNIGLFLLGLRLFTSALPAARKNANLLAPVGLAAATFFPLFSVLILGQLTIVVLLGYALCYFALKKGNDFGAGLALALALVKPQLVLVLPVVLLYERRWRALQGLVLGLGIIAVASVIVVGIPRLDDVVEIARFSSEHWGCDDLSWRGVFCPLAMGFPLTVTMSVLSLALLLFAWRDRQRETGLFDLKYALIVPIGLLISPHLFSHDLTLLILPAFLVIDHAFSDKNSSSRGQLMVLAWVGAGYVVGLLRLFPTMSIFGVRPETLFLIAVSLALAKAILWPGQNGQSNLTEE